MIGHIFNHFLTWTRVEIVSVVFIDLEVLLEQLRSTLNILEHFRLLVVVPLAVILVSKDKVRVVFQSKPRKPGTEEIILFQVRTFYP